MNNKTVETAEQTADEAADAARWRRRANLLFVGFICLVAVIVGLIAAVGLREISERNEARVAVYQAQLESCERLNEVRAILRDEIQAELEQQKQLIESGDYERFFPDIPQKELDKLLQESRDRSEEMERRLQPIDCESHYPDPSE